MARFIILVYSAVCYAIFFVTFLYLAGFLSNLFVPKSIDTGATAPFALALIVNLVLIAMFGVQHSVMARPAFKRVLTRIVPVAAERSTYVLLSSLILILLYSLWLPMNGVIWEANAIWAQTALWAVFGGGFLLVLLSTFVIDHFDLFGLRQAYLNFVSRPYEDPVFRVTFFYKFVRHPLYVGWIMAFWGTPRMTMGHLLFALGMTAYILVAIRYEERDLETFLGEDYKRYREKVPMLVPRMGKSHDTVKPGDHPLPH